MAGGKAHCASAYVRAVINAGVSDGDRLRPALTSPSPPNSAGLAFRATDPNNFVFFRITGHGLDTGLRDHDNDRGLGRHDDRNRPGYLLANTSYRLSVAPAWATRFSFSVNGNAVVFTGILPASPAGTQYGFDSGVALPFTVSDFRVTP